MPRNTRSVGRRTVVIKGTGPKPRTRLIESNGKPPGPEVKKKG